MGEIFERFMPDTALDWTGERLTTATAGQVEIEHLHRYFLARELCRGLDVLDVASGEGYGAALLAQTARSVVGVELSEQAVAHAAGAYAAPNLRFAQGDARHLPLDDASVDALVSFETLEHFFEHDRFIAEARRVLRPGGRLILSSPERDVYSPLGSSANPYHAHELTRGEFEALLRPAFRHLRILLQRPMIGSAMVADDGEIPPRSFTFEKRGPRHYEASRGLPRPPYVVAVASDEPLPEVPNSLFIETSDVGEVLARAAAVAATDPDLLRRAEAAEAAHLAIRAEMALSIAQTREIEASLGRQLGEATQATLAMAARAEAAESANRAAREEIARSIEQAREIEASLGDQLREATQVTLALISRAETAEAANQAARGEIARSADRAREIEASLTGQLREASQTILAGVTRAETAEGALGAAREELARSTEKAREIEASLAAQLREAVQAVLHQVARAEAAEEAQRTTRAELARSAELVQVAQEAVSGPLAELARERFERTQEAAAAAAQARANDAEHDALRQRHYAALADLAALRSQRDTLRAAMRRTAARQPEAAEWQRRYFGLRARMEAILRRFGVLRAARLAPRSLRHFVRERVLGPGRPS